MWPMSERFAAKLPHGHFVVTKAELLTDDTAVVDLTAAGVIVGGSVSVTHSAITRTGTCSLVDRSGLLIPHHADDLFAPAGNEIRLWRGIQFTPDNPSDVEYVPLITARFTAVQVDHARIELTSMFDRAWNIQGAKLPAPLSIAAGTNYMDAIGSVLDTAQPGIPTNFPTTDETTNAMLFDVEADPWEIAQDLAANIGHRLSFDPMGTAVLTAEPEPDDSPVWRFDDADPHNMALAGTTSEMTGVGYNQQAVISENSDLPFPLYAVAKDLDPNSPMRYGGKFKRRHAPVIRDEKIATQAQAEERAKRELAQQLGLIQQLTIPIMPHPALDVLDPVWIQITRSQLSDTAPIPGQTAVVDSLTIPLRAKGGVASLTTRAQRVVSIE